MDTQEAATDVDTSFDRYARMVRRALGVPVALVSLVEPDRQVFPGAVGLPSPYDRTRQTPLTHSFCQYVVADAAPLVVSDARLDDRLRTNLAIPDLGVVAYAGWPLTDHTGEIVGSLCAIDDEPRLWTQDELDSLADLAAACSSELAQRRMRALAVAGEREAHDLAHRSAVLLALSEGLSRARSLGDLASVVQEVALEELDCLRAGLWLRSPARAASSADLPAPSPAEGAEVLQYVEPATAATWESARRHAGLPADDSNPVGRAVLRQSPVFFPCVADQNVLWPHLVTPDQIGEARLVLPLVVRDRVLGAVALIWSGVRALGEGELATFQALASYTAQAVLRARLDQERVDALVTLQTSLLPRLPQPDGLELAARYRPAGERDAVGGDWYDAVVMPSGATALMIGDVVGHDMAAAAVMGQLRTMLRALAWALDEAPSANVSSLERAMHDLDVDAMATLVYACIEDDADGRHVLRWTNAGHPPPLLVEPDGTARWLVDDVSDLMLGVSTSARRGDHRAVVAPGSTLLLYTDGLVERRGEAIDAGLERLRDAAARHHRRSVPAFLDGVLGDLVGERAADDVAVLAVRFRD